MDRNAQAPARYSNDFLTEVEERVEEGAWVLPNESPLRYKEAGLDGHVIAPKKLQDIAIKVVPARKS